MLTPCSCCCGDCECSKTCTPGAPSVQFFYFFGCPGKLNAKNVVLIGRRIKNKKPGIQENTGPDPAVSSHIAIGAKALEHWLLRLPEEVAVVREISVMQRPYMVDAL